VEVEVYIPSAPGLILSEDVETALAAMDMSGGSAWSDLQSYLTSSVKVDYNGETTTLSSIRNMAYDADPEVRKSAYEAEIAAYDKIKDAIAFSLNSIKMQDLSECKLRGHASPLDKVLFNSKMQRATLDALLEAMKEYMPSFHSYLKAKADALGHKNGLPWYDLFAPMGKSDKKYTVEEAKAYLMNIFEKENPRLAEIVDRAFEENWIDFFPREGKVGGAFCAGLESEKEFRVLTNFDGSMSDIVTLAHELGHADDLIQGKAIKFDSRKAKAGDKEEQAKGIENERHAHEMENAVRRNLNEQTRDPEDYYKQLNKSIGIK
jgi:oligoendopeptidase F